jgi:CubicO group peptidase (beta-lactamase class C family)
MRRLRLAATAGVALSFYATAASAVTYPLPVTGNHNSGFTSLDNEIQAWAQQYGITGVTVAVVRDKRLVYEKGFGYQYDPRLSTQEIYPDTKMRMASVSILYTKRALRKLVEDGYLNETTTLVDASALGPWIAPTDPYYYYDARMRQITIGHVLNVDFAPRLTS